MKILNPRKMALLICIFCIITFKTYACTIIVLSNNSIVLVGNNEDWIFPYTKIWFIPDTEIEYGRIAFGFDELGYRPEGGMNSKGLFIDGNAFSNPGWSPVEGKEYFNGSTDYILANCATVDEVIEIFKELNCERLRYGKIVVADTTGKSVIIEYGTNEVEFLINEKGYQISTNFCQSHYPDGNYQEYLLYNC